MIHRLCEVPPIPLSFILAYVLLRRSTYRVNLKAEYPRLLVLIVYGVDYQGI